MIVKRQARLEKDSCNTHNQAQHSEKTSTNQHGKHERLHWKMDKRDEQTIHMRKKKNDKR